MKQKFYGGTNRDVLQSELDFLFDKQVRKEIDYMQDGWSKPGTKCSKSHCVPKKPKK